MPMSPRLLRPRASGFNPRSISGLALWLDAADSETLYTTDAGPVTAVSAPTDISGCVLWLDGADASTVTAPGGSVSEWRDKTAGARHFTASGTAQPTYTATLNGRNVLTFNGSTNTMTGNAAAQDAIRNRAGYTLFAVSKVGSVAAGERLLCGFGATVIFRAGQTGSSVYAGGRRVSGDTLENITGAAGSLASGSSYITSVVVNHTAQSITGILNGAGFASDTTYMGAGTSENTAMLASVGSQSSVYGFYNGDIAEVIIFDTALSTAARARVEAYLSAKWGITSHGAATATNDPVGAWLDKSGNNRHATSSIASQRPAISATTQNSKRLLSLDGSDDRFSIAFPVTQHDPVSMFVVARRGAGTWGGGGAGGYGSFLNGSGGTSAGPQLRVDTGNIEVIGGSNKSSIVGSNVGVSACSIITATVTNRDTALYVEGALVDSDAGAGSISTAGTRTAIGDWNPATGGGGPLQGFFAEMLVYRAALSTAERQRIERYLATKWGITLAPQVSNADAQDWVNRVYANGGTVSTTTANAVNTFCNDIDAAGIRSKFVRLNLFCGTDGNLNAVLVPLYRNTSPSGAAVGNATDINSGVGGALFLSTDYTERGTGGGLVGTSSNRFLNTGVPTNTMSEGNRHLSAYEVARSGATFDRFIGSESSAGVSQVFSIGYGGNGSQVVFAFGAFASGANGTTTTTGGHWLGSNASAGSGVLYKNGSQDATATQTAATPPASELFVFATNRASASATPALAATDLYGGRLGGYSIGLGLSAAEALSFYNAMQAFQTALGRNV